MSSGPHEISQLIRAVPNFPKPGILFYDISTLLQDPLGFRATIDAFEQLATQLQFDLIAGIDARGFVFASALADRMQSGLILIRKRGKLPGTTLSLDHTLEYGKDGLEITDMAVPPEGANRVLLVDDVLATGGTARAASLLLTQAGAKVTDFLCLIELPALKGQLELADITAHSILQYD